MSFKCGIIGLPNVGKSTLFNILTNSNVPAKNFPFCTIKPNVGIVQVPDNRLIQISNIIKPKYIIPANIKFLDIAGLVKGASKGEGLGNKFLNEIRETKVLCHVVRCFENDNITHISGKINPKEDIDIINTELILSDIEVCENYINKIKKKNKINVHYEKIEFFLIKKCLNYLNNGYKLINLNLNKNEKKKIISFNFLTLKPTVYVANVNANNFKKKNYIDMVRKISEIERSVFIEIFLGNENDFFQLNLNKKFFLKKQNEKFKNSKINLLINYCYKLLNLHTFYTIGLKEVRAWTIPIGTNAFQASSIIHTDFSKGFISAKIISFKDFVFYKGEQGSKNHGKIFLQGKKYIIKDGDIINFLFNI